MPNPTPQSIPELWYAIDKRLALIEEAHRQHLASHTGLNKSIDDHEQRLRGASAGAILSAGVTSLLSILAIIKAFMSP